jgi:Flp pilus assembly protein CpaB
VILPTVTIARISNSENRAKWRQAERYEPIRQEVDVTEAKPSSSNYMFLVVAVILGVVATMIAFFFLSAQANKAETEGPKITILVARKNLLQDAVLDPAKDLKEMPVPATPEMRAFAANCFTKEFPPPAKQRLSRSIVAGNPLMLTDIGVSAGWDIDTVGSKTSPAKRAMPIPARGPNVVSGLLAPNDLVVLMMTKPGTPTSAPSGGDRPTPSSVTYRLINGQKIRVLAVGPRMASKMRTTFLGAEQYDLMKEAENIQTITLELTEDQAKEILQENNGNMLPITLLWAGTVPPPETKEP